MTFGLLGGTTPKSTSGGGGGSTVITSNDVMSEIKEIKYTVWLDEYKSFGEESHVFNNKDNWAELMQSNAALNDSAIASLAFNFLIDSGIPPLTALSNVYGTGLLFDDVSTFSELIERPENISIIMTNVIVKSMVFSYDPYLGELFKPNSLAWSLVQQSDEEALLNSPSVLENISKIDVSTSEALVNNGIFLFEKVDLRGRNYSYIGDGNGYHVNAAKSGASYINLADSTIVVSEKVNPCHSTNLKFESINDINKLAKQIIPNPVTTYRTDDLFGGNSQYVTYTSKIYYKILYQTA